MQAEGRNVQRTAEQPQAAGAPQILGGDADP